MLKRPNLTSLFSQFKSLPTTHLVRNCFLTLLIFTVTVQTLGIGFYTLSQKLIVGQKIENIVSRFTGFSGKNSISKVFDSISASAQESSPAPIVDGSSLSTFVYCVEPLQAVKPKKGQKSEPAKFNAVFGYNNKLDSRIDLQQSFLKPARGVIHSHLSPKLDLNGLDYNDPNLAQKLSGPVQYFMPGKQNTAMIVEGVGNENVVWTIEFTDSNGKIHRKTASANAQYAKKCDSKPLVNSTPPTWEPGEIVQKPTPENPASNTQITEAETISNPQPPATETPSTISNPSQTQPSSSPEIQTNQPPAETAVNSTDTNSTDSDLSPEQTQPTFTTLQATSAQTNSFSTMAFVGQDTTLDLNQYCINTYQSFASTEDTAYAYSNENTVSCSSGGVDVNRACREQYGDGRVAAYNNPFDAKSWKCFNGIIPEGDLNFDTYCKAINSQAQAVPPTSGVNGWQCKNLPINFQSICDTEKPGTQATSTNPSDTNSWKCTVQGGGTDIGGEPIEDGDGEGTGGNGGNNGNNGGGAVEEPSIDEDTADTLYSLLESVINNEFFNINIPANSPEINGYYNEISNPTGPQFQDLIFGPLSLNCGFFDFNCNGKYLEAFSNLAKLVGSFIWGLLQGIGQSVISFFDLLKSLLDIGSTLQGIATLITTIWQNPSMLATILIGQAEEFNSKNIFEKVELVGKLIGQFFGDIVIGLLTGGIVANLIGKLTSVLGKLKSASETAAKLINIAEKFVNKTISLGNALTLPIRKVGEVVGMLGSEILNILKSAVGDSFEKLLSFIPEGILKNKLLQFKTLYNTIKSFNPFEIRFSQKNVSGPEYRSLVEHMSANGWADDIPPIDTVRMSDGGLTSIDNRRLLAAKNTNTPVKLIEYNGSDLIPRERISYLSPEKQAKIQTWEDFVKYRIENQGSTFSKNNPVGTFENPIIKN
jgi:hypothetical protein